jgi:hypothetical protein
VTSVSGRRRTEHAAARWSVIGPFTASRSALAPCGLGLGRRLSRSQWAETLVRSKCGSHSRRSYSRRIRGP